MKNVLVGQSGGPTAVINSSLAGVYETAKACGAPHVYGMQYGIEGVLEGKLVDLDTVLGDKMDIELLKRTPSSFLGSCRHKLPDPTVDEKPFLQLFELFKQYDIGAVFYIGGNDSMDTISKLSAYGKTANSEIRFIGVPKTIDNDLMLTDHTPGYGSAAKYIATILKEVICDSSVYDLRSVTVAEIMGRHTGWLAAAASLAAGINRLLDGCSVIRHAITFCTVFQYIVYHLSAPLLALQAGSGNSFYQISLQAEEDQYCRQNRQGRHSEHSTVVGRRTGVTEHFQCQTDRIFLCLVDIQ